MEPNLFQNVTLVLSGIKAPSFRKDVPGVTDLVEPFGEEAKFFSESRLLQRDVRVILEGTNNNSFVGSVIHPNGDIAESLLAEGLAKVVDWTVAIVTAGPEKLRAAESKAKKKNLRLWKEFVPSAVNASGRKMEFDGIVTRIINSDLILVKSFTGQERKITFSSIKAPKTKDHKNPAFTRDTHFNLEAREYLRSRLIGKSVHVIVCI